MLSVRDFNARLEAARGHVPNARAWDSLISSILLTMRPTNVPRELSPRQENDIEIG